MTPVHMLPETLVKPIVVVGAKRVHRRLKLTETVLMSGVSIVTVVLPVGLQSLMVIRVLPKGALVIPVQITFYELAIAFKYILKFISYCHIL